jgi:hypothetical protein
MDVMRTFMALIRERRTDEYIESLLACFAAPTLCGLKPGCLINLRRSGDGAMVSTWASIGEELLAKLKVDAFALSSHASIEDSSVLLMLYKKELLTRAIFTKEALNILLPLGYGKSIPCVEACLQHLARRLGDSFPHEVGLFLGYPPRDVEGFIQNEGRRPKAVGYWKVYGNVRQARKTFRLFRQAEYNAAKSLIQRASASGVLQAVPQRNGRSKICRFGFTEAKT